MRSPADVRTTEIEVAGANCPWCFEETIDSLRGEPGVVAVHGSMTGRCLRIDHHGLDAERLLGIVRRQLHADEVSPAGPEHVMAEVDPHVADLRCSHGERLAATTARRREADDV